LYILDISFKKKIMKMMMIMVVIVGVLGGFLRGRQGPMLLFHPAENSSCTNRPGKKERKKKGRMAHRIFNYSKLDELGGGFLRG